MLEQSMAIMELKKAVINHKNSRAPTHWVRFGDCRNQLVAKYIGDVVRRADTESMKITVCVVRVLFCNQNLYKKECLSQIKET